MATGFGLRLVGRVGGGEARINEYSIPSTDATALFEGDVVKLVNTMDANNELATVTRAATGDVLLGVVINFKPDASLPYTGQYRAASTARNVLVCDDPEAIYEAQEDGLVTPLAAATIGEMQNVNFVVAAGSTVTGLSGTMINSDSNAVTACDLKILGVRRDQDNLAAVGTAAIIRCKILAPAILATDSR